MSDRYVVLATDTGGCFTSTWKNDGSLISKPSSLVSNGLSDSQGH